MQQLKGRDCQTRLKKKPNYMLFTRNNSDTEKLKIKGLKMLYYVNTNQKLVRGAVSISGNKYF